MDGKLRALSIGMLTWVAAEGSAHAGEMFSARLASQEGQALSCAAVNVGPKDVRMEVTLFESGEYDGTPGIAGTSFPPGAVTSASISGGTSAFCRVTFSGNKKNVRASIQVTEANVVVAVLPVQ